MNSASIKVEDEFKIRRHKPDQGSLDHCLDDPHRGRLKKEVSIEIVDQS